MEEAMAGLKTTTRRGGGTVAYLDVFDINDVVVIINRNGQGCLVVRQRRTPRNDEGF